MLKNLRHAVVLALTGIAGFSAAAAPDGEDAQEGWRKPQVQPQLYGVTLAVDVDHDAFASKFGGSREELERQLREELMPTLTEAWTPETGIVWELGPVIVRRNAEESPYADTNDAYEIMRRQQAYWTPFNDSFDRVITFTDRRLNVVGLAGGRWTVVARTWGAWWHELSHTFGNPHGGRGTLEYGSMSQRNHVRLLELEKTHRYTDTEVDATWRVLGKGAGVFDTVEAGVAHAYPPYARLDLAVTGADGSVEIDVLGNDHDVNQNKIRIAGFDRETHFGGTVEEVTRENGTRVLRYTPPAGGQALPDRFMYTAEDETGLQNRGHAVVQVLGTFSPDAAYELAHTEEGLVIAGQLEGELGFGIYAPDRTDVKPVMRWQIEKALDGGHHLRHADSGLYLGVDAGAADGAEAGLVRPDPGAAPPAWDLVHHGGVYFTLRPHGTPWVLRSPYPSRKGLKLGPALQHGDRGYRSQLWVIDRLEPEAAAATDGS